MSTKRHIEDKTEKNLEAIEEKLTSSEQFLEKNQRKILIGLGVLIALVGLAFAYQYLYKIPKNRKAEAAIFPGERYFQEGRDSLALFGDGNGFIGLEEVINQYGGTKTANLAHAYAGISYSRLGKNDKALEHLKKFGASDILVAPAINGKIGDVYMDMGKTDEAISYFAKASDKADDVMLSPIYLKKAGVAYLNAKNYDKAIEIFTKIKDPTVLLEPHSGDISYGVYNKPPEESIQNAVAKADENMYLHKQTKVSHQIDPITEIASFRF